MDAHDIDDQPENAKLEPNAEAIKIELESDKEEEIEEAIYEKTPKEKRKTVKKEPVLPQGM